MAENKDFNDAVVDLIKNERSEITFRHEIEELWEDAHPEPPKPDRSDFFTRSLVCPTTSGFIWAIVNQNFSTEAVLRLVNGDQCTHHNLSIDQLELLIGDLQDLHTEMVRFRKALLDHNHNLEARSVEREAFVEEALERRKLWYQSVRAADEALNGDQALPF